MPKQLDQQAYEDILEHAETLKKRDAALVQYRAVEGELSRHRATVERLEGHMETLAARMPAEAATQARAKAQKTKPWE